MQWPHQMHVRARFLVIVCSSSRVQEGCRGSQLFHYLIEKPISVIAVKELACFSCKGAEDEQSCISLQPHLKVLVPARCYQVLGLFYFDEGARSASRSVYTRTVCQGTTCSIVGDVGCAASDKIACVGGLEVHHH